MERKCKDCGTDISFKAKQARRCNGCSRINKIAGRSLYNKSNPHITRKAASTYRKNHPERIIKQNIDRARIKREWKLQGKYNISADQWETLFDSQSRKCAICKEDSPKAKWWNTDHNHRTGKVRGILCAPCNWILGLSKDNIEVLQTAVEYLEKSIG